MAVTHAKDGNIFVCAYQIMVIYPVNRMFLYSGNGCSKYFNTVIGCKIL